MCGIAGILRWNSNIPLSESITAMTDRIAHRGPDAEGIYQDEHIALGHRRLSIIDLSEAANQPMSDHSGRYLIIYNGEIYNYQEVKERIGHYPYKTGSDTEVILAAYETWGPSCLNHLNGMFAFAIWDKKEEKLFIARDRIGKKPLYYYSDDGCFVFCSEIRGLLASGLVPRRLNEEYLPEYFMFQAPLESHTLVENVKQLKAGHYAFVQKGNFIEKEYWSYDNHESNEEDYDAVKGKVKDLFLDAVRLRMVSDVPVGAFLSGGIDSSLVVACMAELSDQPIETFSISFREKEFDESAFAKQIADKYNTRHHRIEINPEEFLYRIDEIFGAMDSPSGDGPNTYLVAKHTRETGIKVALSGLGGDELFAGYNKFLLYQKIMRHQWIMQIPRFIRRQVAEVMHSSAKDQKREKFADLLAGDQLNLATVYPALRASFRKSEVKQLLKENVNGQFIESRLNEIDAVTNKLDTLSKSTIGEMEVYTRDVLLRDTDQMAMAHALEVRVPFFDYRLVEYVLSLSDKFKFPHTPKKLLVDALSPRLPEEVVNRKKMGFTFPIERWLRKELSWMANEKLNYLAHRPEFNSDYIRKTWKQFTAGDPRVPWARIWQMIVLSDWLQRNKL